MTEFFRTNGLRALKQMNKAIRRGDLTAAFTWTMIADRQLRLSRRFSDLATPRHSSAPRLPAPLPPPPPPPPAPRAGVKDPTNVPGYRNPWVWPKGWKDGKPPEGHRAHKPDGAPADKANGALNLRDHDSAA